MKDTVGQSKESDERISSSSPGRTKVSFYGVYLYNLGQVRIFPYEKADRFNTIDVLKQLRVEFPDLKMTLVWDGAPYPKSTGGCTSRICLRDIPGTLTCLQSRLYASRTPMAVVAVRCHLPYLLQQQS